MRIVLDTNILPRLSEKNHSHHAVALEALRRLAHGGDTFCIGSQTVSEFFAVATRSIQDRGLGMDQTAADSELSKLTSTLEILYDTPASVAELRKLIVEYRVIGKAVHDTRLVAVMNTNAINAILTLIFRISRDSP